MSTTDLIIEERSRDIGDFLVGRLIPFRKKRMVGPFIFIDHMGPSQLGPAKYMDVDQHPHIGLATLTYLLEGEIEHQDSIGTKQIIRPGSVNWMVAGKGVTHTERTPQDLRNGSVFTAHGYQIWVALPREAEEVAPSFHHFAASELPYWQDGETTFRLVAGSAFGKKSPVPVHSPLFMVEIINGSNAFKLDLKGALRGEVGVCTVKGQILACEHTIGEGNLLVSKRTDECPIILQPNAHILLFGGESLPEKRFIHWNFVSSRKERIEQAKEDWRNHSFPKVLGDNTYVPLPGEG